MRSAAFGLAGVLLLLSGMPADARVVFDNAVAGITTGVGSDVQLQHVTADDFVLGPGANPITGVHWTGLYGAGNTPPATDAFTIAIFADDAGAPDGGAPLLSMDLSQVERIDTGRNLGQFDIYSYSVDIGPLVAAPGTPLWLSIVNDSRADADDDWFWTGENLAGNAHGRAGVNFEWSALRFAADFQLSSRVPEPTTLFLLGLGLMGLGVSRRRPS